LGKGQKNRKTRKDQDTGIKNALNETDVTDDKGQHIDPEFK